jgi:hypothetical protein
MKIRFYILLVLFISNCNLLFCQDNTDTSDATAKKYLPGLHQVESLHLQIKALYPALEKLYPIAVAENHSLYIYDVDSNSNYTFIKKVPENFPVPDGIRAAMPLQGYDFKPVCVVTGDAFDNTKEMILVFHEFVHCAQFNSVEMKLKETLQIYKTSMEKKDYMWELTYPFPYSDIKFTNNYAGFLNGLKNIDTAQFIKSRNALRNVLAKEDYEYMRWEEWKEGYARYVENKLNALYNFKINEGGKNIPYDRVSFYYSGSSYINYLNTIYPGIDLDMEKLFMAMK